MPVTEPARHELYESLKPVIGPHNAETFMLMTTDMTPPNGWDELATKHDLTLLRADLTAEMASLRSELTADIERVRADTTTGFAEIRAEMATMKADLMKMIVTSQAGLIAAIALILALFQYLG